MNTKRKDGKCVYCSATVKNVRTYNCICEECYEKKREKGWFEEKGL